MSHSTDPIAEAPAFRISQGDPASAVVVHVPHAATRIPRWVRDRILLDDARLSEELERMTDARTDDIAMIAAADCEVRPWLFVNELSRLVIDPERFLDATREPMAAPVIGMGPVYLKTSHGNDLRETDPSHELRLLDAYFHPYGRAFAELVASRLHAAGRVTIIDLHSYPPDELPYERHHHVDAARPPLCIGTDEAHTPAPLVRLAQDAFAGLGAHAINAPFAGTYVPLDRYQTDLRVASIMIELRRAGYLESDMQVARAAGMLATLIDAIPGLP